MAPVWQQAALLLLTANGSTAPAPWMLVEAPHPHLLSSGIRLAFWMPVVGCFAGTGSQQVTGLSVEQPVLVNTRLLSRRDVKNFFCLLSSSCCCLFSAFIPQILSILLPWQEEVSQCAQGLKKPEQNWICFSFFVHVSIFPCSLQC